MIESVDELEQVISGIEANLKECDRLEEEYEQLPRWAWRRHRRNLDHRFGLLASNAPLWHKLNEGIAPGVPVKMTAEIKQVIQHQDPPKPPLRKPVWDGAFLGPILRPRRDRG